MTGGRERNGWQAGRRNVRTHVAAVKVSRRLVQDDTTGRSIWGNPCIDDDYDGLTSLNDPQVNENGPPLNPCSALGRSNFQRLKCRVERCIKDDISDLAIVGAENYGEFYLVRGTTCAGHLNPYKVEQDLATLAKQMVKDNPEIGAMLLECSAMPPYAWAVQNAIDLPVYDFNKKINK